MDAFFSRGGIAAVTTSFIVNDGFASRLPPILAKQNLDARVWESFKLGEEVCYGKSTDFCRVEHGQALTSVYAYSDSHFSALSPHLVAALGERFNYLEANLGGCPFALGVEKLSQAKTPMHGCTQKLQQERLIWLRVNLQ